MAMNYTPIPNEFLEEMGELSDSEYGRFIRFCQTYCMTGELMELRGNERFYAKRGIMQMDRYIKHFEEAAEKRREAGRMGGLAKASNAKHCLATPSNAKQSLAKPSNTNTNTNTNTKTNKYKLTDGQMAVAQERFNLFWAAYPRHVKRQDAFNAWVKIDMDDTLFDTIMAKLEAFKGSPDWAKENGKYIPYPPTWLNRRRWEDEIETAEQPKQRPFVIGDDGHAHYV